MFSSKKPDLQGTLSFRLTIWYAVIFIFTSLFALSIFYYRISSITMENTDDELIEELGEYIALMDEGGIDLVRAELTDDIESEGEEIFIRLLSNNGQPVIAENTQYFDNPGVSKNALASLKNHEKYVLETLKIPANEFKVRTIYGMINGLELCSGTTCNSMITVVPLRPNGLFLSSSM